jgi:hypothetical protein
MSPGLTMADGICTECGRATKRDGMCWRLSCSFWPRNLLAPAYREAAASAERAARQVMRDPFTIEPPEKALAFVSDRDALDDADDDDLEGGLADR